MSEPKTQPTTADVGEFLNAVADDERRSDCFTVLKMMTEAAGALPVMWGTNIIGLGRYRYRYASGREGEWFIIGFSPRKHDLTLYILPSAHQFPELLAELGKHKTSKSCLYIKRLRDIDLNILQKLIQSSVQAMTDQRTDKPGP